MRNKLPKILVTVAVVACVLGFLVYSSLGSATHYMMVDKLLEAPDQWVDKELKVHGWVTPGSIVPIKEKETPIGRTFALEKEGKQIQVEHRGPAPDTFKDNSEVVATGIIRRRDGALVVEATDLSAKCPSKYEGAQSVKALSNPSAVKP